LGALGFSFFRVTLDAIFAANLVWLEFWKELMELMFVTTIGAKAWIFRERLL
jgi:hypothetical protein